MERLAIQVVEIAMDYILYVQQVNGRRRLRRWWSKPRIRNNYLTGYNGYGRVFRYFQLNDEEEFVRFTRMNIEEFMILYQLVEHRLIKRSIRVPLPPELRLALTLHYLAHGDSLKTISWFYDIGLSTVILVIPEVFRVLYEVLAPLCLRLPTVEEFRNIADGIMNELHFPNFIGVIDGRHCKIKKPRNSGSLFWNYKKFFSVVLMAICDAYKRFIWINVGDFGSNNDAGIFAHSDLGIALANGDINVPEQQLLRGSDVNCPFFLIGDGGFSLEEYLMKPFLMNNNLTVPQRVYNYRLSHARIIIENAFGEWSQTWLVNETALSWKVSTSEMIIAGTICLHNFLIDIRLGQMDRWYRVEENNVNIQIVNNRINGVNNRLNNMEAFRIREQLCQYLVSPAGSVPWQWERL